MDIYTKERTKITVGTVFASLGVIVGLWLCLFVPDYLLYINNKPMLFSKTKVEVIDEKHITTEQGLGYYVITNEENVSEFYLFGKKIK